MRPPRSWRCCAHFLTRHGKRLWRELGFVDAFCESQKLVRRHFSGHRPGADHRDDREPSDGSPVEALHGSAGSAGRTTQARLLEPPLERSRAVTESLEQWLGREYRHAATAMLRSISARDIVKERAGFGQTVRPVAGSIVASPVPASWDPDPDYFFHWFRDSAIVIDAVRLLYEAGHLGAEALTHFADFVRFSLSLQGARGAHARRVTALAIGGAAGLRAVPARRRPIDWLSGDAVYADVRVNPDGTLDISRWTRPQHDGAPLRALAVLRWLRTLRSQPPTALGRLRRHARGRRATPAHGPRVDGRTLARAVARHLGGRARPPLLHVARRGCRA